MADDRLIRGEGCILLVDDEAIIRESLGTLLELSGFRALLADSYDSAVSTLQGTEEVEAIVCDLKMPGKSGLEVLRYVNEQKVNIPLIFLTGHGTLASCQEAVKGGAFDYVLKPLTDDRIIFALRNAIEKYELQKRNREIRQDVIRIVDELTEEINALLDDAESRKTLETKISEILNRCDDHD